jgi:uncharacterized paraquat-inducible protein A
MNAEEIVRALRENAEWCDANEYEAPLCMGDNQRAAADLIESLQAQLAKYDEVAAEYGIDGQTVLTLAKSQIATAADNVKLMEQLTASQRREKAARNELCQKCGRYHEAHKGACDGCRWKGESNA